MKAESKLKLTYSALLVAIIEGITYIHWPLIGGIANRLGLPYWPMTILFFLCMIIYGVCAPAFRTDRIMLRLQTILGYTMLAVFISQIFF